MKSQFQTPTRTTDLNDNTGTLDKEFKILELNTGDRILSQSETTVVIQEVQGEEII